MLPGKTKNHDNTREVFPPNGSGVDENCCLKPVVLTESLIFAENVKKQYAFDLFYTSVLVDCRDGGMQRRKEESTVPVFP